MTNSFSLPTNLTTIYPNPVRYFNDTPVVVFRDHRWTLPLIGLAAQQQRCTPPLTVVTIDRHPDTLIPDDGRRELLHGCRADGLPFDEMVSMVRTVLSPRDDDWIIGGMELGLIGDCIQFSSERDIDAEEILSYDDSAGMTHRVFRLGRIQSSLIYKGAFADERHRFAEQGLWDLVGWSPADCSVGADNYILDIDCDYFTCPWQEYVFPFPDEVFRGEFLLPAHSSYYEDYTARTFLRHLMSQASLVSVAVEPQFCGGERKARDILGSLDTFIFDAALHADRIVLAEPDYPDEQ